MAHLIPDGGGVTIATAIHPGEAETLQMLKKGLSNDFHVFHSVHWARSSKGATAFGEIDFVIVNRSGKVVIIEQKNGPLKETDQGLVKEYAFKDKNLHSQIGRSVDVIRDKFSKQRRGQGLIVDYLIYCPEHTVKNINSPMLDASRIVDAKTKSELPKVIESLIGSGVSSDEMKLTDVISFFAQAYELVPDVGTAITAGEKAYTQLSSGLQEIIENLDFSPFRLRIQGVAGCGKSQVALNFLGAASPDKPTLYACFNRPLCDQMHAMSGGNRDGLLINTFHGLCVDALESVGQRVDFSQIKSNPKFWNQIVESVIDIEVPDTLKFARLVVDEGQDFHQDWWDVLQLFLTEDYELIWCEDTYQNLRSTKSIDVPATVTYRANLSYRTPPSIAEFIARTHQIDFRSAINVPGMGVGVTPYDSPRDQVKILRTRINELRSQGFANEDIVILTCKGLDKSELYGLDQIAGVDIRKFTLEYDRSHIPIYTQGRILFDSVHRFKGGQAPCIILVDVDPPNWRVESGRPVLFCGMTRATVRLEMLVRKDNPHVQGYLLESN